MRRGEKAGKGDRKSVNAVKRAGLVHYSKQKRKTEKRGRENLKGKELRGKYAASRVLRGSQTNRRHNTNHRGEDRRRRKERRSDFPLSAEKQYGQAAATKCGKSTLLHHYHPSSHPFLWH